MHPSTSNLRGIALMVLATGVFVTNDTFMKLATEGLPPLQVLFLRGVSATIWCTPLLFITGAIKQIRFFADRWVVLRSVVETSSVCLFVICLANMPIADITALGQLAPMMMLLGLALFFREPIGLNRLLLIGAGFAGAVLVAQPGGSGFTIFAVLGFVQAALTGLRDVVLRKVPPAAPSLIVAFSAIIIVMIGAGGAHLTFERWVMPEGRHLLLLLGAGLFLMIGHISISAAYRTGDPGVVAPFYYMFAVWAVISGVVVFNTVPNTLAFVGIALILASGITVALLDERKRRKLQVLA
jgi:drug/metabolite transporter (DMT)-like permease